MKTLFFLFLSLPENLWNSYSHDILLLYFHNGNNILLEMAFVAPAALRHLINYKSHLLLHGLNLQEHYHLTVWLPKATKGKLSIQSIYAPFIFLCSSSTQKQIMAVLYH